MKAYKWILCIILIFVIIGSFIFFGNLKSDDSAMRTSDVNTTPSEEQLPSSEVFEFNFSEDTFNTQLVTVINTYRQRFNLPAWTEDATLTEAAKTRAYECSVLGSKGHTRPDGSAWYTVLNISENYNYSEITGISGQSPNSLLRSWVDSETINSGLLSEEFTSYGVACTAVGNDVYCVLILYKA